MEILMYFVIIRIVREPSGEINLALGRLIYKSFLPSRMELGWKAI